MDFDCHPRPSLGQLALLLFGMQCPENGRVYIYIYIMGSGDIVLHVPVIGSDIERITKRCAHLVHRITQRAHESHLFCAK
jgi:hypothetical protein